MKAMTEGRNLLFTVKVLGVSIKVELVEYGEEDESVYGQYDPETDTIELNADSSLLHQKTTLVHELLHVIEHLLGLEMEHKDVYSISQTAWAVAEGNKELRDWYGNLN
jgi:Zn-dependent peptidase ImmA (M78 family)